MPSRRRVLAVVAGAAATGLLGYRHRQRDASLLEFGDEVGETIRDRCRRVERRLPDVAGESISESVFVQHVEPDPAREDALQPETRFERALAAAHHVDEPTIPRPLAQPGGTFNRSSRTMSLLDPDTIDLSADLPDGISIDRETFVDDPLIAHELTHALQGERFDGYEPVDGSRAAYQARKGVTEGAADLVRGRYRATCASGEYDACVARAPHEPAAMAPAALVAGHGQYVNGRLFAYALFAAGGWDAVWEAHRSLPAAPGDVMFPERHLETPLEPVEPEVVRPRSSDWIELEADRLGAFELYTKLFALDIVSPTDDEAAADPDAAAATTFEWAYRSELLRGLQGDRFIAYGHVDDLDRFGYRWQTEWDTPTAARAIVDAVAAAYDERGTAAADGWALDGAFHTVARTGTAVTFGMGPTRTAAVDGLGLD